jgi:hypothetical protein
MALDILTDCKVTRGPSSCGKNEWSSLYLITEEDDREWKGEEFHIPSISRRGEAASIEDAVRIAGKQGLIVERPRLP